MKKVNHEITRYEHKGFYIDIIDTGKLLEAWLSHPGYGISMLLFGADTLSETEVLGLIVASFDEYATIYSKEYGY